MYDRAGYSNNCLLTYQQMDNFNRKEIAKRMVAFRKSKGFTQMELGEIINLKQRMLSHIETGAAKFAHPNYLGWLIKQGADMNYIFTGLESDKNTGETFKREKPGEMFQAWFDSFDARISELESEVYKLKNEKRSKP